MARDSFQTDPSIMAFGGFDDDPTDRDVTPVDRGLLDGLERMICLQLDDGAWWEQD